METGGGRLGLASLDFSSSSPLWGSALLRREPLLLQMGFVCVGEQGPKHGSTITAERQEVVFVANFSQKKKSHRERSDWPNLSHVQSPWDTYIYPRIEPSAHPCGWLGGQCWAARGGHH